MLVCAIGALLCAAAETTKRWHGGEHTMTKELSSIVSLRVDFNFSDPCYVLQLASSSSREESDASTTIAAALSNHAIKLFSCAPDDMKHVSDLCGHTNRITDLSFAEPTASRLAVSSSEDGTVRCWDTRTLQECERYVAASPCVTTW